MKVAALLAATASANPTQFIMDNWWKEAVQVFNFASGNWDQFSSTVDTIPSSYWDPLWGFCNGNGDSEVTSAELTECGAKAAAWAGMSDSTQTFLYNFAAKYWSTVDQDGSGSLNYDEFRYTLAGFAAVDARVILAGFDKDSNGILDAGECAAWKEFVQGHMSQWGWNPTSDQQAAMKAAWNNAQNDGDASTANMVEIAKFLVGAWNVFLH
jgi:hypothetical protein